MDVYHIVVSAGTSSNSISHSHKGSSIIWRIFTADRKKIPSDLKRESLSPRRLLKYALWSRIFCPEVRCRVVFSSPFIHTATEESGQTRTIEIFWAQQSFKMKLHTNNNPNSYCGKAAHWAFLQSVAGSQKVNSSSNDRGDRQFKCNPLRPSPQTSILLSSSPETVGSQRRGCMCELQGQQQRWMADNAYWTAGDCLSLSTFTSGGELCCLMIGLHRHMFLKLTRYLQNNFWFHYLQWTSL